MSSSRSETIVIGGTSYVVRPFTVGDLEEITAQVEQNTNRGGPVSKFGFDLLKRMLATAEPPVAEAEFYQLRPDTPDEIQAAIDKALRFAGFAPKEDAGGVPGPQTAGS